MPSKAEMIERGGRGKKKKKKKKKRKINGVEVSMIDQTVDYDYEEDNLPTPQQQEETKAITPIKEDTVDDEVSYHEIDQ